MNRTYRGSQALGVWVAAAVLTAVAMGAAQAQVKIGNNPTTINPGSVLELESTNRGALFTRIALTNRNTWGLNGNQPVEGMVVYNSTATTGINGLQEGLAVWKNGQWISVDETPYFHVNSTAAGNSTLSNSGATGANSLAAGANASATGINTVAVGNGASARNAKGGAVAVGVGAMADGRKPVAVGLDSKALNDYTTAVGGNAVASGWNSTAIGSDAGAYADHSASFGANAYSYSPLTTALGTNATARGQGATSVGFGTRTNGRNAVAIGSGNVAGSDPNYVGGMPIVEGAQALADNAIAVGAGSKVTGVSSIAIGTGNTVSGNNSGAIGDPSVVTGNASYSVGNDNTIGQNNTFVIGNNVVTTQANAVVLGNNSADRAAAQVNTATVRNSAGGTLTYGGFAGTASGVASVGAAGAERQVINVAPGAITPTSTDAINGSQLYSVAGGLDDKITNVANGITTGGVRYDINDDGTTNYNSVTLGGQNATSTTALHNVAPGVAGTDAVNVNQLNGAVGNLNGRINALDDKINANTKMLSGGVAAAAAMAVVTPVEPGRYHVSGAVAGYNGQAGIGFNLLKRSDNGQTTLHAGVGWGSGGSKAIVRVGFGFSFD